MFNSIRKILFYGNDILKGKSIGYHLNDISQIYKRNSNEKGEITFRRLNHLLHHAKETTSFYKKYLDVDTFTDFPVIKKEHIQNAGLDLLSSKYVFSKLIKRKTSGSYGTPVTIHFSKTKMARQQAELIYYNNLAGLDIGDRYINITTNKKSKLEKFIKNVVILDPTILNERWLYESIEIIQRNKNVFIIGFPSVLYAIAQFMIGNRLPGKVSIRGIITIAEPLDTKIKNSIEEAFGCPVFNRYATMETGVLGFSDGIKENLNINQASYVIEVLDFDSDRSVEEGEQGRIVVTDLFSYAMPLIRYDTGDTAKLEVTDDIGAVKISYTQGRMVETIFRTDGSRISWAVIYDAMEVANDILQYQFLQTDQKSYQLRLVVQSGYRTENESELIRKLRDVLGDDAMIDFSYNDSIPPLPSGKRPMIMNLYRKESLEFIKDFN